MRTKEIILAVLIILAGIFLYYAKTGRLDWEIGWDGDFFRWNQEEFVYEESQEISPPFPAELQVLNAHGNIEVQGTETDKVIVSFTKRIWRKKEKDAKEISDQLKLIINKEDLRLIISTNREEFRRRPFETDFKLSLPAGMKVLVKNSYGLVRVSKTGTTEIKNPHGDVFASNITGPLVIQNTYEDVEVHDVQSNCQIETSHSSLSVFRIQGEMLIQNRYGEIHLEDVAQNVTIEGRNSEVLGKNLKGVTEIESSYEKITLSDTAAVKIRAHHCDVEASDVKELLDVKNEYGRVEVKNIQGDFRVVGKNLNIYGQSIVGKEIFLFSTYENIELSQFSARTIISLSHGDLILEPVLLVAPIEVKGEYSNIRLYWPSGGKFPVEARTKGGTIKWNLQEKPSLEESNGTSVIKAFQEEESKPSLILSTTYGNIRIEELSPQEKSI